MKKKVIPVLVAIVLIFLVVAVAFGSMVIDKYSYSKEFADMEAYYGLEQKEDVAIVLQDEILDEKARLIDGTYYFGLDTVTEYFTDRFYINDVEQVVLFTTGTDVIKVMIGDDSDTCYIGDVGNSLGYKAAVMQGDTLYIAVDYVRKFVNFSCETFSGPNRMQVYTQWDVRNVAGIKKKSAVRYQGGIKSNILEEVYPEDTVVVLEQLENWSKVKTNHAVIGYIENKYLSDIYPEKSEEVNDVQEVVINSISRDHKINLGFHQVFNEGAGDLEELAKRSSTLNVVAPTWFRLNSNEGGFHSIANAEYVNKAHSLGLEVWAVLTDVDSQEMFGLDVDFYTMFVSSENRQRLINALVEQALTYGIDGINIDLEGIKKDAGPHFVQFLRELSIQTRANNIVLSVDNFVPTEYTAHYNRAEQGLVADYIIIMGYDEHYAGGGEAGSVASIGFVESGITGTKEVVPKEKIINAIPFYTRVWEVNGGTVSGSTLTMRMQQDWVSKTGSEPVWNDETCQNYVECEMNGTTYQCWLEDVESIQIKLNVMQAQEIAGVASWKLGIEDKAVWEVIDQYVAN